MRKAKAKSTASENVVAAYDRIVSGAHQTDSDVKVLWGRICEVEAQMEDLVEDTATKLAEVEKERRVEKERFKSTVESLKAEIARLQEFESRVHGAIKTPVFRKVPYTPEGE